MFDLTRSSAAASNPALFWRVKSNVEARTHGSEGPISALRNRTISSRLTQGPGQPLKRMGRHHTIYVKPKNMGIVFVKKHDVFDIPVK